MFLIDTHCHLSSRHFLNVSREGLVNEAKKAGLCKMVTLGSSVDEWEAAVDWTRDFPGVVHACLGIHPNDAAEPNEGWKGKLEQIARDVPLAAIGEAGLDYYHPAPEGWDDDGFRLRQQILLDEHFEIAAGLGLNIVLHTRDRKGSRSFDDAVAIARRYAGKVKPVFHCFIGTKDQARVVFDELDGLISITGIATFKNSGNVSEVARWCPEDRLMLETDSPYLAPEPMRGKQNQPAYLAYLARHVAELRGVSVEALSERTYQNACRFFRLDVAVRQV